MKLVALLALILSLALPHTVAAQTPAPCTPAGNIQFVCGQQSPEDLIYLPGTDWVVASAFGVVAGFV